MDAVDLSFDIPADSAVLEILKPASDVGTGWIVEFAGPGHVKTVEWIDKAQRKSIRKAALIEQAQNNNKKYKAEELEPAEARRENVQWVVSRIINWTPIKIGGETFEFSEKSAVDLLTRPNMGWAFVQMVDFLVDERSFIKGSATT